MSGDEENAELIYIIRDHDATKFQSRIDTAKRITDFLNARYGKGTVECHIRESYRNMRELIEEHMEIIERAKAAYTACGVTPIIRPIRGGTDGARLTYMGLPCPNLGTGSYNHHGRMELASVQAMEKMVDVLLQLVCSKE